MSVPSLSQAQIVVNETFTTGSAAGWTFLGAAALTGNGTTDPVGDGWLRLTPYVGNQAGLAAYTGGTPFTSANGVLVELEYASWGSTLNAGADGLSVFLYDATKDMDGVRPGGSLGYCWGAGGYLGIGLDEWGNFTSTDDFNRCSSVSGDGVGTGRHPQRVVIRGPLRSDGTGNPYVTSVVVSPNVDENSTTRPAIRRRVRFSLVPNGLGGYRVSVAYGYSDASSLADVITLQNFNYVAPSQLRLGFAASTGANINYHEVRNVTIRTPADVRVTKTVDAPQVLRGRNVSYTVVVSNQDINPTDAGNQSPDIIGPTHTPAINDDVPSALESGTVTWTCVASTGSTCPADSGTGSLSGLTNYTLASGGTLTFTITGRVATTNSCGATVVNTASAIFPATSGFADMNPDDNSASASFEVICPTVQIRKISTDGVGTFSFQGSNGIASHVITTVTAGAAAAGNVQTLLEAGTATTITEDEPPAGFVLDSASCSNLGSDGATDGVATFDAGTRTITLDAAATIQANGNPIVCTFTNRIRSADLSLQKTVNGGDSIDASAGSTVDFTIVVRNGGPDDADGAVVADPAVSGLACSAASCSSTDTALAACPGATGAALVSALQTGVAITPFRNGGELSFSLTCTVE